MRRQLLTCFGLGNLKPAPGTWGSLPPVILAFALVCVIDQSMRWQIDVILFLVALCFSIACIKFGDHAEEIFKTKDPSQVVADEVAGQSIPLLFLPWYLQTDYLNNAILVAIAFISFRFFDILKPPPASGLQKLPAGWGILVDDLIAGIYALIITQAVARFVLPSIL